jgi:hypothetical protein
VDCPSHVFMCENVVGLCVRQEEVRFRLGRVYSTLGGFRGWLQGEVKSGLPKPDDVQECCWFMRPARRSRSTGS